MMKRQDSLLSTSRRETTIPLPENHHAKSVGCMSGIFRLFSKYQNRNKLLTFGRKYEKKAVSSASKLNVVRVAAHESPCSKENNNKILDKNVQNFEGKRLSNDMEPRSPALSQKIRQPDGVYLSEQLRTPRALVARLMGLDEQPATVGYRMVEEEESTEAKRQRLLQALEKCNEDLEALKKIIKAVQSPVSMTGIKADCGMNPAIKNSADERNEQLSPVCVLDQPNPSILRNNKLHANGIMAQQCKKAPRKKPYEDDGFCICFFNRDLAESFRIKRNATATSLRRSKTMIQSIDEVCNDIVRGEKREAVNIGLLLQNHIWRDLIEEIVKELGHQNVYRLPFLACRRRLSF